MADSSRYRGTFDSLTVQVIPGHIRGGAFTCGFGFLIRHSQGVCVCGGYLVDDINAVSELLALQEGVQVVEQQTQVVLPGTVGHDDGRSGAGLAPCRAVTAPSFHPGIPLQNVCQRRHWTKGHGHGPHCREGMEGIRGPPGTGSIWGLAALLGGSATPKGSLRNLTSLEFPITGTALQSLEGAGSLRSLLSYFRVPQLSCLTAAGYG